MCRPEMPYLLQPQVGPPTRLTPMKTTVEDIDARFPDNPGEDRWFRHFMFLHWVLGERKPMAAFIADGCERVPLPLSTMRELVADWESPAEEDNQ